MTMRVGLTGGIGSGKSTVAQMWVAQGAHLIDTDAISRSLTAPGGAALPSIAQGFGSSVIGPDGALDRAALRERVFTNPAARRQLESILHPMIGEEVAAQALQARQGGSALILFDVPLLAESAHWRQRVDRVVVVDCPESLQEERVVARSGWPVATVRAVMGQQATRAQRRAGADAVLFNGPSTGLDDLQAAVKALHAFWAGPAPQGQLARR